MNPRTGLHVRKGDEVLVLSGKDAGRRGKVINASPREAKVVVEGVHLVKKHLKPTQKTPQGGIVEKPLPVHVSNLMLVCPRCHRPTRARNVREGGRRARRCRRCGEIMEPAT